MKKPVCLLIVCLVSVMTYAQNGKASPVVDNPSIRKSEKAESKQAKEFATQKRYGYLINSPLGKAQRKQQAKAGKESGKGKGL